MKKIFVLKTLVDIVWILFLLGVPSIMILGFLKIGTLQSMENIELAKIVSKLILMGILFAAVYNFRIVVTEFFRNRVFSNIVISNLDFTGKLLLLYGSLSIAFDLLTNLFFQNQLKLVFSINESSIAIIIGLFLRVISEIFKISKFQKEENELTI